MKWLGILLALLVAAVVFAVPITGFMVRSGLKHPEKSWAPKVAVQGGRTRMRLQMFGSAKNIFLRTLETFPQHQQRDRITYWIALCYEKEGEKQKAMDYYKLFLQTWPNHMWKDQAQRRLGMLQEQ